MSIAALLQILALAGIGGLALFIGKRSKQIMSRISEFAAAQKAFNERQATALGSVSESVTGLAGDVGELNRKIQELQNSPGEVTPEDQALLDELVAQGGAAAERAESVAAAVKALDDLTPPAPPAE